MVNYNNGKIYKIEDLNGEMCYYGLTTKERLCKRMTEHKRAYKCWKLGNTHNMTGAENTRITLMEEFP